MPRNGLLLLPVAFLTTMQLGCTADAGADATAGHVVEREIRGDTTVVRTVSGSLWGDSMQLVPEVAIGRLDGAAPYIFGQISGLAVDGKGNTLVLDRQAAELRVYSREGEHRNTLGGHGEGPGELRQPDQVRVTEDGRILVRDGYRKFSIFSADGEYLTGWPLQSGYGTSQGFHFTPEGRIENPTLPDRLVRYDLDGTAVDTVPVPSHGYAPPRIEFVTEGGTGAYGIPFMPAETWTRTADGDLVFARTDRYAIDVQRPEGGVLRIERVVEPVPVAVAERDQAREQIVLSIRGQAGAGWEWSGPEVPRSKPYFWGILPGADGTLWVMRRTPAVERENPAYDSAQPQRGFPTRWVEPMVADVFDEEGEYLGAVRFPEDLQLHVSPVLTRDAVVAAVMTDGILPQVVRYRLE